MSTEEPAAAPPSPPAEAAPVEETTESKSNAPASGKGKGTKIARARPSAAGGGSKKASAAQADSNKSLSVGDTVLARLRGYPPWPARIADPDDLPRNVLAQRPSKSPQIHCVQFFPVGDYAWLKSQEITPLSADAIRQYLSETHRKAGGGLRDAYETARDPSEWDALQAEHRRKLEADEGEVDELADEEDGAAAPGDKRKRAAGEKKAKAKKAKTDKKKSAADVEEEEDDAPKPKGTKGKADKKAPQSQPKAAQEQPPADDDPLANNPECVKVKDWRHKLQRAFLGKGLPSASEMDQYDSMFKTIEAYKDITIEALQYSKIGKVMKKIATLNEIPRNDELKITDRAGKLMQDWQNFIASNESKANGSTGANGNGDAEAAASGDAVEPVEPAPATAPNPPTPPEDKPPAEPQQSEADPAVNGTGEGEGAQESTKAE